MTTTTNRVAEFDNLLLALNKIIFGTEADTVTLNGIIKPTISKFLRDYVKSWDRGYRGYLTFAEAQAASVGLTPNTMVEVSSDPDLNKNGVYQWNGTVLTKSTNDSLTAAKAYVDEKVVNQSGTDIAVIKDSNGMPTLKITNQGKVNIIGISTDIASAINGLMATVTEAQNGNIIEIRDLNNAVTMMQKSDGDLIIPNVGNLTFAVSDLRRRMDEVELKSQSEGGAFAAHLSGKYADYNVLDKSEPFEFTGDLLTASTVNAMGIFPHDVVLLRIPAITRIGKTKYLLFFEARLNGDDFGDNSQGVATFDIDLVTKTASVYGVKSLHSVFTDDQNKKRTFMNACAVKLDSGKIICLYVRRHGTVEHELYMRTSTDDGVTWSDHVDITSVKGDTGWNLLCPCSQGLVKRFGRHKGRIIFPLWTSGRTYSVGEFRAGYIYSDDEGLTWHLGEFAEIPTGNEVQAAEDMNGDMLFSIRLESRNPPKVMCRHSDVTKEYEILDVNTTLTSEAIMSGLIQGDNIYDRTPCKFQLTACKNANRTELLIHTSYNGGVDWHTYLLPSTIGSAVAYSCIENITDQYKLLLWESGFTKLAYAIVSMKNLIEG